MPYKGAGAEQVPDCRNELQGLERLSQECRRGGTKSLPQAGDGGDGENLPRAFGGELTDEPKPCAARNQEVDEHQVRRSLLEMELGLGRVQRDHHLVAFGAEEVLGKLRRVAVSFGNQDKGPVITAVLGRGGRQPFAPELLRQQSM